MFISREGIWHLSTTKPAGAVAESCPVLAAPWQAGRTGCVPTARVLGLTGQSRS